MIPRTPATPAHGEESPAKPSGDPLAKASRQWHEKTTVDTTASTSANALDSVGHDPQAMDSTSRSQLLDCSESAEGADSGNASGQPAGVKSGQGVAGGVESEKPVGSPMVERLHAVEHSIATHASGAVNLVVQAEQSIQHAIGHGFEAVKKTIVGDSGTEPPPTSNAA
jgi:hypothetical protein